MTPSAPRCFETLHSPLTTPFTITTSAPPPPPASDPVETQAGKVQEAQVRWREGWREGERWTSNTPHGGRWQRGDRYPRALSSLPQSLTPPPGSSSRGMVDSGDCQRRVCSLNPRPALPNFPFSLPSPPRPPSLLKLICTGHGRALVPELTDLTGQVTRQ